MTHQVLVQILADVGGQLHRPDEDEEDAQQDGQGLEHDRAHLRHGDGSSFSLSHLHPCVYLLPSITDGTLQEDLVFSLHLDICTHKPTQAMRIYIFGHPHTHYYSVILRPRSRRTSLLSAPSRRAHRSLPREQQQKQKQQPAALAPPPRMCVHSLSLSCTCTQ